MITLLIHQQHTTIIIIHFQKVHLILFIILVWWNIRSAWGFYFIHYSTSSTRETCCLSRIVILCPQSIFTREHRRQPKHIRKIHNASKNQLLYSSFFWGLECSKDCKCGMTNGLKWRGLHNNKFMSTENCNIVLLQSETKQFQIITLTW